MSTKVRTKLRSAPSLRGDHLRVRNGWFHYYRVTPRRFRDVEAKRFHALSLQTQDYVEAKAKAATISRDLNRQWEMAVERGQSLKAVDLRQRYLTARQAQQERGFEPASVQSITDEELVSRLRSLLLPDQPISEPEQKAILGLVDPPALKLTEAFDRFWDYIRDEWSRLSHDQVRTKRNVYLKSIRNFQSVVGQVSMYEIKRSHAIAFRSWWQARIENEGLKADTANREMDSLRRLININFDIDSSEQTNPFRRVRIKPQADVSRIPFSTDQIKMILNSGVLKELNEDFCLWFPLLVNTGMRPVEAIGLDLEDIVLDGDVPHVHVRRNDIRGLKTAHSDRQLPLLGVSLEAAKAVYAKGGWGKRAGKNMYATSMINRVLRAHNLTSGKKQSLYSLRHWFQDQLTKADVVDRAQAQLMGHKFHRPRYGYGKDLSELKDIIEKFAIR